MEHYRSSSESSTVVGGGRNDQRLLHPSNHRKIATMKMNVYVELDVHSTSEADVEEALTTAISESPIVGSIIDIHVIAEK